MLPHCVPVLPSQPAENLSCCVVFRAVLLRSVSVRPTVTSRQCIATAERIELLSLLFFLGGIEAKFGSIHCGGTEFGYFEK